MTGTLTAAQTVEADVGDDHGDTRDQATAVEVPSETEGWIEEGADADYFEMETTGSGTLSVHAASWIDNAGTLYDADGEELATDEDSGEDWNFRLSHAVEAGKHYVRVTSSNDDSGAYMLHVSFTPDEGGSEGATASWDARPH